MLKGLGESAQHLGVRCHSLETSATSRTMIGVKLASHEIEQIGTWLIIWGLIKQYCTFHLNQGST